jgi:hypothetical protein
VRRSNPEHAPWHLGPSTSLCRPADPPKMSHTSRFIEHQCCKRVSTLSPYLREALLGLQLTVRQRSTRVAINLDRNDQSLGCLR